MTDTTDACAQLVRAMRNTLDALDGLSAAMRQLSSLTLPDERPRRKPSPTPYRSANARGHAIPTPPVPVSSARYRGGRHRTNDASTLDLFRRRT